MILFVYLYIYLFDCSFIHSFIIVTLTSLAFSLHVASSATASWERHTKPQFLGNGRQTTAGGGCYACCMNHSTSIKQCLILYCCIMVQGWSSPASLFKWMIEQGDMEDARVRKWGGWGQATSYDFCIAPECISTLFCQSSPVRHFPSFLYPQVRVLYPPSTGLSGTHLPSHWYPSPCLTVTWYSSQSLVRLSSVCGILAAVPFIHRQKLARIRPSINSH